MSNISCLSLLYQSQDTRLKSNSDKLRLLNQLKFVTRFTIQAVQSFYIDKNLRILDPHIGESLCQIRAYQFIIFLQKSTTFESLEGARIKINELCNHIHKIDKEIYCMQTTDNSPSSNEIITHIKFVTEKNIQYFISEELFIVASSYFLTIFKYTSGNRNSYIDYRKISAATKTSLKYAKKISHYYQKKISEYSCLHIQRLSQDLLHKYELFNFLQYLKRLDDDFRSVLPCYLVTKIILLHMCQNRIPVVLTIHRFSQLAPIDSIALYFKSEELNKFTLAKMPTYINAKNQIAIHIHGIANFDTSNLESRENYIDRLQNIGLMELILANMAIHPQYPGIRLNQFSFNPYSIESYSDISLFTDSYKKILKKLEEEFLKMKCLGKKIGCTLENSSLFLIEHISCGMIAEILHQSSQEDILESIEA